MPILGNPISTPNHEDRNAVSPANLRARALSVYLMDLWCFIPYYMAELSANLQAAGIKAGLGSTRYHLDRSYFQKAGVNPDPLLLDFGGGFRSNLLRRVVKSCEYVINLAILALRFLKSRPDVLHVEYLRFLDFGLPLERWFLRWVRWLRIPIVYTIHNVTYQDAPHRHKSRYAAAYRLADILICHGQEARAQLMGEFGTAAEKIRVIPHGPLFDDTGLVSKEEARARLGLDPHCTLVLSLGVISEYKGIPFLLDAWKQVAKSPLNGRLLIAGTGDAGLLKEVKAMVMSAGLESSVDLWLHFIPAEQVPILYQAADILVYPYKAGTTSGALLTGMNYAKPVIATTLPFFQEHLRNGKDALLVEYGQVDELAEALHTLMSDAKRRNQLGQALALRRSKQPTWGAIAASTIACYEALLAREIAPSQDPTSAIRA